MAKYDTAEITYVCTEKDEEITLKVSMLFEDGDDEESALASLELLVESRLNSLQEIVNLSKEDDG